MTATTSDREYLMNLDAPLPDIEHRLPDSEGGFLRRLDDLLTRDVLSEAELGKANRAERDRNARLQAQRIDITKRLNAERDGTALDSAYASVLCSVVGLGSVDEGGASVVDFATPFSSSRATTMATTCSGSVTTDTLGPTVMSLTLLT
jgi:hypothetical protein